MKIKVALVFGGKSTEHEISIISALQSYEWFDRNKYEVFPVYLSKENEFYFGEKLSNIENYKNLKSILKESVKVQFVKENNRYYIKSLSSGIFSKSVLQEIDVAFLVVHGTNVEDGNLTGYFHTIGLPVSGPNVLSASLAMDKYISKKFLKEEGIPVLDAIVLNRNDVINYDEIENKIKIPAIVKAVNLGSSIGIYIAKTKEELKEKIEAAFAFSENVLIERAVTNLKEINCALLGDSSKQEVSALEEPILNSDILSFADKYLSGGGKSKGGVKSNYGKTQSVNSKSGMASLSRKIPAEIDKKLEDEIKTLAVKIFKLLRCSGVARLDFIIDMDENKAYFNEINMPPGSLAYYLFEPVGISKSMLVDKIVDVALKNKRIEEDLNFTFESNVLSNISNKGSKK
jgi:D-alanine-D-alanine ligase